MKRLSKGRTGRMDRRGQALAEMTIVLPILLLLVFGIVELSNAWRTFSVLTNSAREGARSAVVAGGTFNTAQERVIQTLRAGSLSPDLATISAECWDADEANIIEDDDICTGSGRTGTVSRILVEYPYTFAVLTPLVRWTCGDNCTSAFGTITIASTSAMRNE